MNITKKINVSYEAYFQDYFKDIGWVTSSTIGISLLERLRTDQSREWMIQLCLSGVQGTEGSWRDMGFQSTTENQIT